MLRSSYISSNPTYFGIESNLLFLRITLFHFGLKSWSAKVHFDSLTNLTNRIVCYISEHGETVVRFAITELMDHQSFTAISEIAG